MDAVKRPHSLRLPRARAHSVSGSVLTDAASVASEQTSSTSPALVGSRLAAIGVEAAGGAVRIVAAGGNGSGWARDEESDGSNFGRPAFWRRRTSGDGVHGLSGRTGRRVRDRVRQNRIHLGNVPTPECECMSMYESEGRVRPGTTTVAGYSVSSATRASVLRADEPARGVGGLLQPAFAPAEPPVSSFDGFSRTPTTTAPAPIGVLAGEVSPRTSAVRAAVSVEPAGRLPTG
jgi:hypothetical protein